MGNLIVGTEVIKFRDAILQVNRNIQTLHEKLNDSQLQGCTSPQIRKFYEEKIESQKITLAWLRKHYQNNNSA